MPSSKQPDEYELRRAFARYWRPAWGNSFEDAMQSEILKRSITIYATHIHPQRYTEQPPIHVQEPAQTTKPAARGLFDWKKKQANDDS